MLTITTRRTAKLAGLHKYYTGKPCRRGHDTLRYTATGMCRGCRAVHSKNYRNGYKRKPKLIGRFEVSHPDDMKQVMAYVEAVNLQRSFTDEDKEKTTPYPKYPGTSYP